MSRQQTKPWQADLDLLEQARIRVGQADLPAPAGLAKLSVNPALELIETSWRGLAPLAGTARAATPAPVPGNELVLVWRSPTGSKIRTEAAQPVDLLALKIITEGLAPTVAAEQAGVAVGVIDTALLRGVERGILLQPASGIRRPPSYLSRPTAGEEHLVARTFTLQWHITQACDLDCRHCYDRGQRRATTLDEGLDILDQLREFCRNHFVPGQVSFSGGNPFLHPRFADLYRAAAERGFDIAILGNPVSRESLEEILAIRRPVYLQVSLEGLEEHDDFIRGAGHFQRTLAFLDLLRELAVPSEVMLTLTRDNLRQVLPLAEVLRGRTGAFTFCRLAAFGSGARLAMPAMGDYAGFLREYLNAMPHNPVLALKDNLSNIHLKQDGRRLFSGCSGYGCGAAFNFVALLPDGEVHACRKFPSPIGHIHCDSLADIYNSPAAHGYRTGCSACSDCPLKPVCGGCPAVTAGAGLDPAAARDPFCFYHGQNGP